MTQPTTTQTVMEIVLRSPGCHIEDILHECPGLTWNQVFLAIDYLSRAGEIRVTLDGERTYRIQAHYDTPVATPPAAPALL